MDTWAEVANSFIIYVLGPVAGAVVGWIAKRQQVKRANGKERDKAAVADKEL